MRLLRTAAGGFVNAERIVRVVETDEGFVAVLADATEAMLPSYYSAPGRLAQELPEIVRVARGSATPGAEDTAEPAPADGCAAEACCGG